MKAPSPPGHGCPACARADRATAIGALAACVAHDVNNMLCVVLTYADSLLDCLEPGSPCATDVHDLRLATLRATDLVRQLLSVGRRNAHLERLDLDEVVRRIEPMLCALAGRGVTLRIAGGSALWPVRGDRGRLEEVVINLVTNARDAMDGSGVLSVETTNVGLYSGPHVVLCVRDSGCGIDEATKAHLFEPFFTTKDRSKGSGLGLAVVAAVVEEMGGTIDVTSEVGRGSAFRLFLPRDELNPRA